MGVMACDRRECENVMCRKTVLDGDDLLYICDDCAEELNEWRDGWPADTAVMDVRRLIKEFMDSEPGTYGSSSTDPEDVRCEFRRLGPSEINYD